MDKKLENFHRAFRLSISSIRQACRCGVTYFNYTETGGWETGEFEKLVAMEKSKHARSVDYNIGVVVIDGIEYVDACSCWHDHAGQMMRIIDGNANGIARYLTVERERKIRGARLSPVVDNREYP